MVDSLTVTKKDVQYMTLCKAVSRIFSTCSKKQYAAILVDELDHVVGFGYNGGPRNSIHCNEGGCPRFLENSESGSSYDNCIAVHAEANALLHSDYSSRPKKIYVNGPPCFTCAKLIVNSTIQSIYCVSDHSYKDWQKIKSFLSNNSVHVLEMENASV
jgi:dCMP deaminase